MIKWLGFLLVFFGLSWSHSAHATGCAVDGYTDAYSYKDCVHAHVAWSVVDPSTGAARFFATPLQAAQTYFDEQKSSNPAYCSYQCYFTLTADYTSSGKPGNPPIPVRYFIAFVIVQNPSSTFPPPPGPASETAEQAYVCPANYTQFFDLVPGSSNHGEHMCRPAPGLKMVRPIQGDLTNPAGCVTGCNPVDLGDRHKVDWVVDYQNKSPYPIVWSRAYSGLAHQWFFNYDRSLAHSPYGATLLSASATLRRQDGQVISFTGTRPTTDAPWVWAPDVGSSSLSKMVLGSLSSSPDLASFNLLTHTDETESYNEKGQLTSIRDVRNLPLFFQYDTIGRLIRIDDASGRFLTLSYPGTGTQHTTTVSDENGQPVSTNYPFYSSFPNFLVDQMPEIVSDGSREAGYVWVLSSDSTFLFLDQVVKPDLKTMTYHYDAKGQYLGLTDENGDRFSTYTYSQDFSTPDTVTQTYHGDHQESISYGQGSVTYPNGHGVTYGTNSSFMKSSGLSGPCSWCGGTQANTISYDASGNPTSITDFKGNLETRVYDQARGVPTSITEAGGTAQGRTTTYTWDSRFLKPATIVKPAQTRHGPGTQTDTYNYDDAGNLTSWTISIADPQGATDSRSGSATYNAFSEPLTITDARGKTHSFTYDTAGNRLTAMDALGHVTTYGGYDTAGNPGWIEDPNGLKTEFTYDALQRVTQVRRGCATGAGCHWETSVITYNPMGAVAKVVQPNGRGIAYHYDTAHRRTGEDILGADGSVLGTLDYTLSTSSEVTAKVYKDASGTVIQTQGLGYDDLSRLTSVIDSHSKSFGQVWDAEGNLASTLDPLNHGRGMTYDALNRLTQITLADNTTESISYGLDDTVISQTDALGHVTAQSFNGYGEVVGRSSPDSGATGFARDANGNVVMRMDARTVMLETTYDDLDRPLTQEGSEGGPSEQISWSYDSCLNGIGRLCSVTDRTGATAFTYDLWGRVASKTVVVNTRPFTVLYGYDTLGQLTTLTYPSGAILTQTWANGEVVTQQWGSQTLLTSAHYDPLGRPLGWSWASGRTFALGYDLDGRVDEVEARNAGVTAASQTYIYDDAWRLTGVTRQPANATTTFGYDNRDRLTSGTTWGSYTYDANSNRLSWLGTLGPLATTYGATNNRLATWNGTSTSVDAAGNLLSRPGLSLTYDFWDRLRTATAGGVTTTYGVNGMNERVSKTDGTTRRVFVYAGVGHLLGVYDGTTGAAIEELAYLGERPVATVRSGVVYPIETDHLMAPLRVLDGTNTVVWSWEDREPFGASAPTTSGFVFNLRFPGQWADSETGLVSNGFRDYDPVMGRYVESDPLGLEAGSNTYGYANGTPISSIDTLGLETVSFDSTVSPSQRSSMMQLYTLSKSTLRQDSMMNTLVDQIESSTKEIVLTNSEDLDYISKVNGNAVPWNPHLSFKIGCSSGLTGYMSPMIGLGHEFNHLINDPNKFVRFLDNLAANHDPRVKIKNFADYDRSYTEYVTINGPERHAQMTFGEVTRDNHRYYGVKYVADPTKPWGRQ